MANNDPQIVLFEAYLNQRLSPEQSTEFEKRLEAEPDFQAQFERYQQLAHLLEGVVEDDAFAERQNRLENLSAEIETALKPSVPPQESQTQRPKWQILVPLAAIFILLLVVFWPSGDKSNCDPQSLYLTYAQEWSSFHFRTMMSAGQHPSTQARLAAAEAYGLKEYQAALELLESYLADTMDSEARLLQALCHLRLGQYEACLHSLAEISPDSEDYEEAVWIKALASLQQADYPLLRRTLEQIVLEQNPHQNEAQKIEQELDCLSLTPAP